MDEESLKEASNYTIEGLTVESAEAAGPTSAKITTTAQAPDTVYQIAFDVADVSNNKLSGSASVATYKEINGYVDVEYYNGIDGTALSVLYDDPIFVAGDYSSNIHIPETNTKFVWGGGANSRADNYGAKMSGWIIAPQTGEYRFFFHSDDNGEFYLSTDETMDNTEMLCEVAGWANTFVLNDDNLRSAVISLEQGKKYYFEAFWKEGGGGDNCGIAWRLPSEIDAFNTPPDASSGIPGKYLVSYAPEQFPWYGGGVTDGTGTIQRVPGLSTTLSLAATIGVRNDAEAIERLGFSGSDTFFAPTDEAWAALPDGVLADLQANTDKLTDVFKYHIINSHVAADNLEEGAHTTVLGKEITVTNEEGGASYGTWYSKSTDTIMINDAKVLDEIYSFAASVVIIDKVLIPPTDKPTPPTISVMNNGDGTVTVTFEGKLQTATSVIGPWADVEGATSPLTIPADQAQQYGRSVK